MPKHAPSYKHLVSTSSAAPTERKAESKSVNERIASSRAQRPVQRDTPPHLASSSSLPPTPDVGRPSAPGDAENGSILPAELLRRANLARLRASRAVAGPAPPPSWMSPTDAPRVTRSVVEAPTTMRSNKPLGAITTSQLEESEEIFQHPLLKPDGQALTRTEHGTRGLVEYCLLTLLRYAADTTPIELDEDPADLEDRSPDAGDSHEVTEVSSSTLGEIIRAQIQVLEPHLKNQLLQLSSLQPEGSLSRLSDTALRSLLASSGPDDNVPWEGDTSEIMPFLHQQGDDPLVPPVSVPAVPSDEWDDLPPPYLSNTFIRHLPLMLHPNPMIILRQLPSFGSVSLSSLNLAYCKIPDIESLVTILPLGLRELSLAGTRFKLDWNAFRRAIQALGKKLIVLRMLDLSYIPLPANLPFHLRLLLHPAATRLPSLRVLGLKGWKQDRSSEDSDSSEEDVRETSRMARVLEEMTRKEMIKVIRGDGRTRYVEVIFDDVDYDE